MLRVITRLQVVRTPIQKDRVHLRVRLRHTPRATARLRQVIVHTLKVVDLMQLPHVLMQKVVIQ